MLLNVMTQSDHNTNDVMLDSQSGSLCTRSDVSHFESVLV